jgi:hypothetical protein
MRTLGSICAVLIGLTLGGCGDDDDDPKDDCQDLVKALCEKAVECTDELSGDDADEFLDQCISQAGSACEDVGEYKGDIDECIDAIEDTDCDDFQADEPPNACE